MIFVLMINIYLHLPLYLIEINEINIKDTIVTLKIKENYDTPTSSCLHLVRI